METLIHSFDKFGPFGLAIIALTIVIYIKANDIFEYALIKKYLKTRNQEDGRKALFFLIKNNSFSWIEYLIREGVDINFPDKKGNTALIKTALNGNYYIVKTLLNNGADINTLPKDMALILACENEDFDKAKYLIEHGANVNFKILHTKETPLIFACKKFNYAIMKLLLENGADVNAKNSQGRTALSITYKPELVELLKSYGAKE